MPRRKKPVRRSQVSNGGKLLPTVKKQGIFKGPGVYAAKQTGIQAMKKAVPAYLMVVALSAATPPLGASIASAVSGVPVVNTLTNTAVGYGTRLRARIMPGNSL